MWRQPKAHVPALASRWFQMGFHKGRQHYVAGDQRSWQQNAGCGRRDVGLSLLAADQP